MTGKFLAAAVLTWAAAVPTQARTVAEACPDRRIAASEVRTEDDLKAFVECAHRYVTSEGTAEAYRAFHSDEFWRSGEIYLVVSERIPDAKESKLILMAADPQREGKPLPSAADSFGDDFVREAGRILRANRSGYLYYSIANPVRGRIEPKVSYVVEIDWDGVPALMLAGIYRRDLPATCGPAGISAARVSSAPTLEGLEQFVRCAASELEEKGYLAIDALTTHPRWSDGNVYVYVMDAIGNQLLSGSRFLVNGYPLHEWGGKPMPSDQFAGRDTLRIAEAFGESYLYYSAFDPGAGAVRNKVGFVKRVVTQGVPLLVGAGFFDDAESNVAPGLASGPTCEDNYVSAGAIRTRRDLRAFVRCAKEYVNVHGTVEARRAFHEDERWRSARFGPRWGSGPIYVFVDRLAPSGADATAYVYPPNPSREGAAWGQTIDWYGTDLFADQFRILSGRQGGWSHNAFINPWFRRVDPKLSYIERIEWDGNDAMIGAGLYEQDLPGTCDRSEVSAAALEAEPSDRALQAFVRCAAFLVERHGLFAAPILERSPRWNSGNVYVFGVNATNEGIVFSGSEASFAVSGRISEALFDSRDLVTAAAAFGEAFWYYDFLEPATGLPATKVSFLKRVMVQGAPILVGSGYYRPAR